MATPGNGRPKQGVEIVIAGRSFTAQGVPPRVNVPPALMLNLRLSDLPEDIGIRPLGLELSAQSGWQVDCLLYGLRDGSAWARVEVSEPLHAEVVEYDWPSTHLTALADAVQERKQQVGDTDIDTEIFRGSGRWRFSYLIDIGEDLKLSAAFERVQNTIATLKLRSEEIAAGKDIRSVGEL